MSEREDIEREEFLDDQDPLRHLRSPDADGVLVPAQPPSILNQRTDLLIPGINPGNPGITVKLALDAAPGCGGIAWPAGEVLSSYLLQQGPSFLENKTVLELGSGTGLVGLVAGYIGAERVWITDQSPLLDIMRQNVQLNSLSSTVTVAELNWGDPLPPSIPHKYDVILAADCVYFEPAFPLLAKTLADLVPDKSVEVLFCYKKRRKADKHFFTLLTKEFTWTEVADDVNHETYTREAISLLRLVRK
ncbi:S-adenosyl-L-methionine-dependent methyltransferase [Thelephora ganbajun]|uniref:S-adenosyl-L-methionine-dependent methyltransferase n=1 Tax=Thelephora ganbajun TaxID=370292 RepID=A0ACB6ZNW4_THEGA|nr:S-adenosyl-L-methionine-dependent methyltransferase [Thelephora ganbajun]